MEVVEAVEVEEEVEEAEERVEAVEVKVEDEVVVERAVVAVTAAAARLGRRRQQLAACAHAQHVHQLALTNSADAGHLARGKVRGRARGRQEPFGACTGLCEVVRVCQRPGRPTLRVGVSRRKERMSGTVAPMRCWPSGLLTSAPIFASRKLGPMPAETVRPRVASRTRRRISATT